MASTPILFSGKSNQHLNSKNNLFLARPSLLIAIFLTLITLTSCDQKGHAKSKTREWMTPNGHLKVLATTEMIADVVKQIGKTQVDTITLIQGELDPHSYQLVKGDDEKLSYADIIFYNGLGLEHGPSLHHFLENHRTATAVGDAILRVKPDEIISIGNQKDPHIWMDIGLWKQIIPFVVQTLSEKDPFHAEEYRLNGQKLYRLFDETDEEIRELLQSVPQEKRYLVTSHDAFNYFTRAYLSTEKELLDNSWQMRFQAPEGLSPESQISTQDIAAIIEHLQKYQIHILFPESNISKDSIKKIVEAGQQKGLNLTISPHPLYGDAMGPADSPEAHYLSMVRYNAELLKKSWMQDENTSTRP